MPWTLVESDQMPYWVRVYEQGLTGAISFEPLNDPENPYLWVLFVADGPGIDVGRGRDLAEAQAAADYNSRTNYTLRRVREWRRGPARQPLPYESPRSREARLSPRARLSALAKVDVRPHYRHSKMDY